MRGVFTSIFVHKHHGVYMQPRLAVLALLRCKEGDFACHFGIKCSSFCRINVGTSCRTACGALGYVKFQSVKNGNGLLERTIDVILSKLYIFKTNEICFRNMDIKKPWLTRIKFPAYNHFPIENGVVGLIMQHHHAGTTWFPQVARQCAAGQHWWCCWPRFWGAAGHWSSRVEVSLNTTPHGGWSSERYSNGAAHTPCYT